MGRGGGCPPKDRTFEQMLDHLNLATADPAWQPPPLLAVMRRPHSEPGADHRDNKSGRDSLKRA
eukprot:CAMPEP_0176102328 /NCGR_PEP_ID=MMETSP0120_2-20121206/51327_1 /TAXON_ID=160619 /ORGANISM="Kryptoperidinium foliaceum, Strain CCMP 1326" /LENGTH=63 /DNA_ID=CAMNT_0017436387 /DNA_START=33 /DNA_END=224 /DNA_ORIENTATION=-